MAPPLRTPFAGTVYMRARTDFLTPPLDLRLSEKGLLICHAIAARATVVLVGAQGVAGTRSHDSIDRASIVTGASELLLQAHYA